MSRLVVDALAARFGGTAYATVAIAKELASQPLVDEIVVIARSGSIVAAEIGDGPGVTLHELRRGEPLELVRRTVWEGARLHQLLRPDDTLLTMSGMLPRHPPAPLVCFLCNPVMLKDPGGGNALRRAAARRTCRRAAAVLVPTEEMARLAWSVLGVPAKVVPLGVDHSRFTPRAESGSEVLCVGDLYAHKRHELVLAAWSELRPPRPPLRLIGSSRVDPRHADRVRTLSAELSGLGEIHVQEGLPAEEVVGAYRRARVFVLPSERESFCMPALEALACGVPVVLRDSGTLRETGGDGGLFVASDDPRDWAKAIQSLIDDSTLHATARSRGLEHAAGYRWVRTAEGILEALSG